jgi:HSP20 family protein
MSLIRRQPLPTWDPFRDFQDLSEHLNRMFQTQARPGEGREALRAFDWAPAVNISETDKAYLVKVDLPEVKKEDVKITQEAGVLTIEGERRQEKREDGETFHRVESSYGRFMRRFTLPDDAQEDGIEAAYKDGMLSVTVPKAAAKQAKARQIAVG